MQTSCKCSASNTHYEYRHVRGKYHVTKTHKRKDPRIYMGQIQHEYLITKILQSHHHHPKSRSLIVENSLERRCHDVRSRQHHLLRSIFLRCSLSWPLCNLVALREKKKGSYVKISCLVLSIASRLLLHIRICFQSTSSE
jgi:hypothetical protein